MSREDYVAVGTRLFAVYVGIKTLFQIPALVQGLTRGDDAVFAWLYVLALLLVIVICSTLWVFPLTIARKLLPVMKEPRSEQTIDAAIGLSLGLILLGAWLFTQGFLDMVYWLTLALRTRQLAEHYVHEWNPDQIASMTVTVFELALGAWLVLGNSGIRRLIYNFRYGSPAP